MARILIVDDDPALRDSTAELLRLCGHEADAVANGAEAMEAVDRVAPDAILTDLFMPVMDGIELILTLRRKIPNIRIIAMSGQIHPKMDILRMARSLGADGVVSKPFRRAELCQAVDDALLA